MDQLTLRAPDMAPDTLREGRNIWIACVAAVLFGVLAYASIAISRYDGPIASIWLPNAMPVAILLRARLTNDIPYFAAIFVSSTSVNMLADFPTFEALIYATANLVEIIIATMLTRRLCGETINMESMQDLGKLIIAAGFIAPLASASIALIGLSRDGSDPFSVWLSWYLTDGLEMIVFVPLLLLLASSMSKKHEFGSSELIRTFSILSAGSFCTLLVFSQSSYPLLFIIPPIVLICAFQLGSLGTATFVLLVSLIATYMTWLGTGPINLVAASMQTRMHVMQAFVAASFLTGLPVSAILAGRERITEDLAQSERQLALLADNITDTVLRYDLNGICTYASASVIDVLGEISKRLLAIAPPRGCIPMLAKNSQLRKRTLLAARAIKSALPIDVSLMLTMAAQSILRQNALSLKILKRGSRKAWSCLLAM
ncbi:MAG: MASE1 domain-containing protein [Erythrobacter sp.]